MGIFRRRQADPVAVASKALANLDDEERSNLFLNSSRPPNWAEVSGGYVAARVPVTLDTMISIPAVSAAIRLLAETISMLPLNVYKGRGEEKRLADQTWQYRLLTELPGIGDFTPIDLISDIVSCLEWEGNAFLRKVKTSASNPDRPPEVIALLVIDPTKVEVKRVRGEKMFKIRETKEDGTYREETYSQADILHIRGWTPAGSDRGYSPLWMNREKISSILAQQLFQGKFFSQGMLKPFGLEVPGIVKDQERFEQSIQSQIGLANAGRPFVAQQGAHIVETGMTLRESQFIEGDRQNMIHVAHMLRIPPSFLVPDAIRGDTNFEQDNLRFYTLGVAPRLRRIELAFFTDSDMFPQRVIYPEFDVKPLLRTDAKTQAEVDHFQIQDGSRTRDELRARDGLEPLPDGAGAVVPETPTGAGNPAPKDAVPAAEPAPAPAPANP